MKPRYKEVKVTRYLLSLGIALLLLAVMVVPVSADTGETEITANLEELITINAPTGAVELILATETNDQSLITASGNVTSNVAYDVTAVDAMEASKLAGDAGKMVDWETTAEWTTASQLTNVVKVGSSMAVSGVGAANLSTAEPPLALTIISDAPAGTDVDSQEIVTIDTVIGDTVLAVADHWYKITITFTAVKHT